MTRFEETIELMNEITSDIKTKASEKLNGLSEVDAEKINIIADKTVNVIEEATSKLKEAVEKIADENELNLFLDRVKQKCVEAKDYALEKFEEIVPYVNAEYKEVEEILNEDINNVEAEAEDVSVPDPVVEIPEEEVPPTIEELVEEEPAKEENLQIEKEIKEVVANFKEDASSTMENLLDNENIKQASDFIVSVKDNVVDFLQKPETRVVIGEIKLTALKVADKGLDLLIKAMDNKKKEETEE